MNIKIIANFPSYLDGRRDKGRFLYLGEMLCERGHQVEMIVSDFEHGSKKHRVSGSIKQDAYKTKITALHEAGYPNNISFKRLWSHFVWGQNVEKYLKSIDIPDIIYCAVPSLTAGVRAARYCKKHGVRFIIDVQDLWPEAFEMTIKNKLLQLAFLPFEWYVNKIYSAADAVIAVSDTYVDRAFRVNKKTKKGLSVFLGNDGALFEDSMKGGKKVIDSVLQLAYIGSLSYSYDIPCVIEALKMYKLKGFTAIRFVVMGEGTLRNKFETQAAEAGIDCEFTGNLPYTQMVSRLCVCDIVVNPIVKSSAASIINKVGDYALSGLPVINTQESQEYRDLVNTYKCGINCECGNPQSVANALEILAKDPALRKEMGENARKLGVERFDRRNTYKQIVQIIEQK